MLNRRSLLSLSLAMPFGSQAQALPDGRPMRWIVPFAAGGAADAIARNWASSYTGATGQ